MVPTSLGLFKASCSSVYLPDCAWFLFDDFLPRIIQQVANKCQFTLFLFPDIHPCHHESEHLLRSARPGEEAGRCPLRSFGDQGNHDFIQSRPTGSSFFETKQY